MLMNQRNLSILALVLLLSMTSLGCEAGRFIANAFGDGQRTVQVKAQYTGLENQTFAVLVATDEYTTFTYPAAAGAIGRSVTADIASSVPGSKPMDPQQVLQFQKQNPYWITIPYGQLIQRLGVDRLVIIDLVEFTLREPGNAHVWQGQMVGNIGVAEAGANNGNALSFTSIIKARFPDDSSRVGVLDSDDKTIQLGLVSDFTRKTVNLFRDHQDTIR